MSLDNWILFWQWLLWNSQRCSKQFIFRGLHNWIMQMLQWKEDVKIDISCCMPFYVPFCKFLKRALNVTYNAVDIYCIREEKQRRKRRKILIEGECLFSGGDEKQRRKGGKYLEKISLKIVKDIEKSRFRSLSRDFCQFLEDFGFGSGELVL